LANNPCKPKTIPEHDFGYKLGRRARFLSPNKSLVKKNRKKQNSFYNSFVDMKIALTFALQI